MISLHCASVQHIRISPDSPRCWRVVATAEATRAQFSRLVFGQSAGSVRIRTLSYVRETS